MFSCSTNEAAELENILYRWFLHVGRIKWLKLIWLIKTLYSKHWCTSLFFCVKAKAQLVVDTGWYKPAYITPNFNTLQCGNMSHLFYVTKINDSKNGRRMLFWFFSFPPLSTWLVWTRNQSKVRETDKIKSLVRSIELPGRCEFTELQKWCS